MALRRSPFGALGSVRFRAVDLKISLAVFAEVRHYRARSELPPDFIKGRCAVCVVPSIRRRVATLSERK
jgi:hypothetical protein